MRLATSDLGTLEAPAYCATDASIARMQRGIEERAISHSLTHSLTLGIEA